MTPAAFKSSLALDTPPQGLSDALAALWWAGKNNWDRAHKIVMESSGPDAAWVHAYLHRVEGDLGNAAYWYRSAKQPVATGAIEDEWQAIGATLLAAAK